MGSPGPLHHAGVIARIGLIGAECSGKSTLATALAEALPACVVPEELRAFVARHGRPPRPQEQAALMAAQATAEQQVAELCRHPWLVADPAPLMTAVYSLEYFDDDALVAAAIEQARIYHLIVWCDPGIPWQPDDGQRDGPARRTSTDAVITDLVHGPVAAAGLDVLKVTGTADERVAAVLDRLAWQPGRPVPPT